MKMFSKFAVLAALGAGSMFAGTITQTLTTPTQNLELNNTNTFQKFQSAVGYVAGDILNSVTLQIKFSLQLQALDVTNQSTQNQTFDFITNSTVNVIGTAADTTTLKNAIAVANGFSLNFLLFDTGNVTYLPGQDITFVPPVVNVSVDSGVVNASSINPYNAAGTFTLGGATTTFSGASGGGGNFLFNQTTVGTLTETVIYNYTAPSSTPEPATMTLFGSALLGIGFFARKRIKKS